MSSHAAPEQAPVVHKGSELLLRKIPLYAQARQYLQGTVEGAAAEENTLGYGPSTYPVLALVRATRTAAASGAAARAAALDHYDDPFSGIGDAALYNLPWPRKWQSGSAAAGDGAPASETAQESLRLRVREENVLMNAAAALDTGVAWVEPVARPLAVALAKDAQRQREERRQTKTARSDKEEGDAVESKRPRQEGGPRDGNGRPAEEDGDDDEAEGELAELDAWFSAHGDSRRDSTGHARGHPFGAPPAPSRRRGGAHPHPFGHGGDYLRRLRSFVAASPEEVAVLSAARQRAAAAVGPAPAAAAVAEANATVRPVPAEQWGARMAALVTASAAAPSATASADTDRSSASAVELQQQVQAYLKRVTWLERQRGAAAVSQQMHWNSLSDGERVQREMERAKEQRKRFHRVRKGGEGEDGGTD